MIDMQLDPDSNSYQMVSLTDKQERFVYHYCGSARGNGTRAARLAGYSGDDATLASMASHLLRNDKVAACIRARMEDLSMREAEITMRLSEMARASVADAAQEIRAASNGQPAIVKVDLGPIVKALEVLARINGMIVDRQRTEQTGEVKVTIHHSEKPRLDTGKTE